MEPGHGGIRGSGCRGGRFYYPGVVILRFRSKTFTRCHGIWSILGGFQKTSENRKNRKNTVEPVKIWSAGPRRRLRWAGWAAPGRKTTKEPGPDRTRMRTRDSGLADFTTPG